MAQALEAGAAGPDVIFYHFQTYMETLLAKSKTKKECKHSSVQRLHPLRLAVRIFLFCKEEASYEKSWTDIPINAA